MSQYSLFTRSILLVAISLSGHALAQAPGGLAQNMRDDAIHGQSLIRLFVDQAGGEARLKSLNGLHFSMEGDAFNGLQGYDPANAESESSTGPTSYAIDLDYSNHRYRRQVIQVLSGGIRLESVTHFSDGLITTAYPGGQRMTQSPGAESALAEVLGIPALFARRALANISSASFVCEQKESGELIDIVEISWDPNTRVRAHLRAADHRLLKLELAGSDPLLGDDDAFYVFEGERLVAGIKFPEKLTVQRRGHRYQSFKVKEISVNPAFEASIFDRPKYQPLTTATSTNSLGGGAYEITGVDGGVFRVIFFDLGDSIAVFDAPGSRSRSRSIAAEIRKSAGDKPIRYVVVSHFHDDHLAGIGYYIDHGAQIVTTRANAAIIQRYATVESKLHADLPAEGRVPSFLFVDGNELVVKGTSGHSLSVYKLPNCPHAKDMLVAYLPSEKLLVQADLLVELAAQGPTSAAFAAWLNDPSAPPVEHIVGTHLGMISRGSFDAHGSPRT